MAGSPAALQVAIAVASLSMACLAGFYIHPLLLPVLTETLPSAFYAVRPWLTAPVLFVLLNLVVGALFISSSGGFRARQPRRKASFRSAAAGPQAYAAPVRRRSAAGDDGRVNNIHAVLEENEDDEDDDDQVAELNPGEFEEWVSDSRRPVKEEAETLADSNDDEGASTANAAPTKQAGVTTTTTTENPANSVAKLRLVRSKSEMIPPRKRVSLQKSAARSAKKADSASAPPNLAAPPRILAAPLPPPPPPPLIPEMVNDDSHVDVDKKAEAFINRFKMQRIDSMLRRRQQQK